MKLHRRVIPEKLHHTTGETPRGLRVSGTRRRPERTQIGNELVVLGMLLRRPRSEQRRTAAAGNR
jgi:hypothetical protein